jgi:RimJ/RimL family protein N-acetyltransferase
MNTPEWIKFIGDRNVPTLEAVSNYIAKVKSNPLINYLVVRDKESSVPMGIVTFIKRDYLDHWDVGFAFLSRFTRKGYAYEAAKGLLTEIANTKSHTAILASVLKENSNSIKLLERLGFEFNREIYVGPEKLQLYSISTN